jgi:hypothetical protein
MAGNWLPISPTKRSSKVRGRNRTGRGNANLKLEALEERLQLTSSTPALGDVVTAI